MTALSLRWIPFRALTFVRSLTAVAAAGFFGLCCFILWDGREDARLQALTALDNVGLMIEQDIARNFEFFDLSLQGVIEGLQRPEIWTVSPATRQAVLFDTAANASYLNAIRVLDADGNIVLESRPGAAQQVNLADRDYFQIHRNYADAGLFVSPPFQARIASGNWIMALSRRIDNPDGSFGGVVFGTLTLDYFTGLFGRLSLGPNGIMALFHANKMTVMRQPFQRTAIGQESTGSSLFQLYPAKQSGEFEAKNTSDGVERLFKYRQIKNFPLIINIGAATTDIYAAWRYRAGILLGLMGSLGLATLALAHFLRREFAVRRRAELEVRVSESRYRLLSTHSTDAIVLRDLDGVRRFASPAFYALIGMGPEELGDRKLADLLSPEFNHVPLQGIQQALATNAPAREVVQLVRTDGQAIWLESLTSPFRDDTGNLVGVVSNMRDVTARKALEDELAAKAAELAAMARQDGLTGLANRRGFDEKLGSEWHRALRDGAPLSLLMIDVDFFKAYNDALGHLEGDDALRYIAERISLCLRPGSDLGARYGGEEFAVVLPGMSLLAAWTVAEKIRGSMLHGGLKHPGSPIGRLSLSIGVAVAHPSSGSDSTSLVRLADEALYRAKQGGRNCTQYTAPSGWPNSDMPEAFLQPYPNFGR